FGSASGKVFAAFLPDDVLSTMLNEERRRFSDQETARRLLEFTQRELAEVRKSGLAFVRGDYVAGTSSLAAPGFDGDGQMAATVAVIGRTAEISVRFDDANAQALLRCTRRISEALGYRPID